jgi:hypothetical protein
MPQQALDEEVIFQVARRIGPSDARAAYLDQVCGADRPARSCLGVAVADEDAHFWKRHLPHVLSTLLPRPAFAASWHPTAPETRRSRRHMYLMAEHTMFAACMLKISRGWIPAGHRPGGSQRAFPMDHVNIARVSTPGRRNRAGPIAVSCPRRADHQVLRR